MSEINKIETKITDLKEELLRDHAELNDHEDCEGLANELVKIIDGIDDDIEEVITLLEKYKNTLCQIKDDVKDADSYAVEQAEDELKELLDHKYELLLNKNFYDEDFYMSEMGKLSNKIKMAQTKKEQSIVNFSQSIQLTNEWI